MALSSAAQDSSSPVTEPIGGEADHLNKKASANGVLPIVTVAAEGGEGESTPKASPRPRMLSEISVPISNGKLPFELEPANPPSRFDVPEDSSSFLDCDEHNILAVSEFQSSYSINEFPEFQPRGDTIATQLPAPPDGGYGWLVVACAFICNFIVDGISNSFGAFMASYQQAFDSSKAATSVIGSLLIGVYLLSGPIAGGLLNNFDARKVVIAGTILSSVAFALSALSPNIFVHYVFYGFFGGIGFGFIFLPAIVVVSQYFESKRALATGIAVAGSGFGTFVMPLICKYLIGAFGWKITLLFFSLLILVCVFCGLFFRPLPVPEFDLEKQNRINEELKQQALLAALSRAEGECLSVVSEEENETAGPGGISPLKRSATTRTSSQGTREDGQPLLANEAESAGREESAANADGEAAAIPSPKTPHRPPLSPIPEAVTRRLSKSRAGSQHQQTGAEGGGAGVASRHPTISRTRKPTLVSMASDAWMGSSSHLRLSRANLSRVSARSYAQSLSRISQAPGQYIKAGESVASVAMSGIEPKEFARPMSRHDIFLQGSIKNLKEFDNEGRSYQRYRESQISIPLTVAAQNLSTSLSQAGGDMIEASCRFGGSQYSRITGDAFGTGEAEFEEFDGQAEKSKFKCVPFPVRHAISEMVDLSLLLDPVMLLLCLSNMFAMLGFYVPFVYLIDLATDRGISQSQATLLLSIIGITNTFGRVFFGWAADRRWVTALSITNCSLVSCGLLTLACPLLQNFLWLTAYASLFGFIVSAYVCLTSIVLSDLLGVERLTNSFGLIVVARGIASLLGTPIAGIVFDLTQSFNASFYFAGVLILLAGLVSSAVSTVHRHQRSQLKNEGDYEEPLKKATAAVAADQLDAQSGKLSVLTERSEEYYNTIQSLKQQRALMKELEDFKQRNEVVSEEGHEEGEEKGTTSAAESDHQQQITEGEEDSQQKVRETETGAE